MFKESNFRFVAIWYFVSCIGIIGVQFQVEHVNAQFKAGLIQLCGNYTEAALQRVAMSLDISEHLRQKLLSLLSSVPVHC